MIVAGAGPVGGFAACLLAERGIEVIVLEAGQDCARDLRASTFHPPTLEMLDTIGIAGDLVAKGLKAPVYHWRERQTGAILDFDMAEIADRTSFPFRVQCEQFHLSRALADRLQVHPSADIRFGHRVAYVEQDADGVSIAADTPTAIARLRADYLIGADGASSLVRKWLGIGFEGFTYPEKFLTLSTTFPIETRLPDLAYVNYVADPAEWVVLLRVPSVWRVLVPASEEQADAELLSDARKAEIFDRLIGEPEVATEHRTIYRVHQRVAERFVEGRVFLIGDAAHLNNPLGGFGMNSGIHDAWNLADKIVGAYAGRPDGGFARFDRQRRRITHGFVQAQTKQNMALMRMGSEAAQAALRARMAAIHADPARRRDYILHQSMITARDEEPAIQ